MTFMTEVHVLPRVPKMRTLLAMLIVAVIASPIQSSHARQSVGCDHYDHRLRMPKCEPLPYISYLTVVIVIFVTFFHTQLDIWCPIHVTAFAAELLCGNRDAPVKRQVWNIRYTTKSRHIPHRRRTHLQGDPPCSRKLPWPSDY